MGMWKILGHYLASSGWTIALTDAVISTAGTADSFLNASVKDALLQHVK